MNLFLPVGDLAAELLPPAGSAVTVRPGATDLGALFAALLDNAQPGSPATAEPTDVSADTQANLPFELPATPASAGNPESGPAADHQAKAEKSVIDSTAWLAQAILAATGKGILQAAPNAAEQGTSPAASTHVAADDPTLDHFTDAITNSRLSETELKTLPAGDQPDAVIPEPANNSATPAIFGPDDSADTEKPNPATDRGTPNAPTRTVTIQMDRDAWEQIQRIPNRVQLEIPVELDIPDRPVPVGHEIIRQLQALTEQAGSTPTAIVSELNHAAAAKSQHANKPNADLSHLFARQTAHTAAPSRPTRSLGLAHPQATPIAETKAPNWQHHAAFRTQVPEASHSQHPSHQTPAEFEATPRLDPSTQATDQVAARTTVRSAIPVEVSTGTTRLADLTPAPQVRFIVNDWAPGRPANQLQITLDPAELGGLKVHLSTRRTGIFARIIIERPEALPTVQANFDSLRATLAQRGINFSGFSVTLANGASAIGLRPTGRFPGMPSGRKAGYANNAAADMDGYDEAMVA